MKRRAKTYRDRLADTRTNTEGKHAERVNESKSWPSVTTSRF